MLCIIRIISNIYFYKNLKESTISHIYHLFFFDFDNCSSPQIYVNFTFNSRFDYSSWKVDCSVYMMILVTKLTYYGFALKNNKDNKFTLLEYFSYCFFFPSLLVGPTFSFERYLDFINLNN